MHVEEGMYEGKPVLTLKRKADDKYGFTFGFGKAKMVLEAIEDVKKFVEKQENQKKVAPTPTQTQGV